MPSGSQTKGASRFGDGGYGKSDDEVESGKFSNTSEGKGKGKPEGRLRNVNSLDTVENWPKCCSGPGTEETSHTSDILMAALGVWTAEEGLVSFKAASGESIADGGPLCIGRATPRVEDSAS